MENDHVLDWISLEGSHHTFLALNSTCERNSQELPSRTTRKVKISSVEAKALGEVQKSSLGDVAVDGGSIAKP